MCTTFDIDLIFTFRPCREIKDAAASLRKRVSRLFAYNDSQDHARACVTDILCRSRTLIDSI